MTIARFLRIARERLRIVARRAEVERDIDRELALHLDALIREKVAAGLTIDDARREAAREFGAFAAITEQTRDARGITAVASFFDDARFGLRLLRRTRGFTAMAGLALAIGIGATAAAAGAMAFVLVRPLPFPDSARLFAVRITTPETTLPARTASIHQYRAWLSRSATISAIGASRGGPAAIGGDSGHPPMRVQTQAFTPSLFALLGVRPHLGRVFEDVANPFDRRALVAVISHRLWQRRFGAAADVVGRPIVVDGRAREIVGVLPAEFRLQADNVDLWLPLILGPDASHTAAEDVPQLLVTVRLRPSATRDSAHAELEAIARDLHPERRADGVQLTPLRQLLYGWAHPRLLTLAAMAALLLALSCANVASLLLARGRLRRRELAMRAALGAPRRRIVRQILTESLVIGACAALPAVAVASVGLRAVSAALGPPPGLPRLVMGLPDLLLVLTVGCVCIAASLAFGALPAIAASRTDLAAAHTAMQRETRKAAAMRWWPDVLVAAQIAVAVGLTIAALLISSSYTRLSRRPLNFEPRGLVTFGYSLRAADVIRPLGHRGETGVFEVLPSAANTFRQILQQLVRIPDSGRVAGISFPPVNSLVLPMIDVTRDDGSSAPAEAPIRGAYFIVTPHAFAALRTPIVRGREFDHRDAGGAPATVVINETMAQRLWPGAEAIGRRLRLAIGDDEPPREVVGVVADIPARLEQPGTQPTVYTSFLQQPRMYHGPAVGMFAGMTFLIRPTGDASEVLAATRRIVAEITPDRPVDDVGTVQGHLYARLGERRNYALTLDGFALLAALLAVVGLHSRMTHTVAARANEIAVRRALGAPQRAIVVQLTRSPAALVAAGFMIGSASALAASPMLAPQLWDTRADAPTLIAVALGMLAAAAIACAPSVRRALAIDASRLRCE